MSPPVRSEKREARSEESTLIDGGKNERTKERTNEPTERTELTLNLSIVNLGQTRCPRTIVFVSKTTLWIPIN